MHFRRTLLAACIRAARGGRLGFHLDHVCHADALRLFEIPGEPPTALVANLPYNVSVPVILHLLERFPTITRVLVMVQLEVADNGPGFQRELMGQVFDPYVTSKPKGTGLGLAIVKKIVEEHGAARLHAGLNPRHRLFIDEIGATVEAVRRCQNENILPRLHDRAFVEHVVDGHVKQKRVKGAWPLRKVSGDMRGVLDFPGPEIEKLQKLAQKYKVFIGGHAYTRDPKFAGRYFNNSFLLDRSGNIALKTAEGTARFVTDVLRKALAKDPQNRFPTCKEFAAELERTILGNTGQRKAYWDAVASQPTPLDAAETMMLTGSRRNAPPPTPSRP